MARFFQPFVSLWKAYSNALNRQPLLVQAASTGVLMASGDAIAQKFIEKKAKYDMVRGSHFLGLGTIVYGPLLRYWYLFLSRSFTGTTPTVVALKMMIVDQTVMAPIFITTFLSLLGVLRRDRMATIKENLTNNVPTILVNNWKLWPAVQMINFYMVPLNYRVLVVNFVALIWNTYVSYAANRSLETVEDL